MLRCLLMALACLCTDVLGEALTLTNNTALQFPNKAPGDAVYTLPPASGAQFTVTGAPNATYTITAPANINMTNGASTVRATNFATLPAAGNSCCTLNAAGTATIQVGARSAAIGAAAPAGLYSGTFSLAVRYPGGGNPVVSANGTARITVIQSIAMTKVSDLRFGVCSVNDPAKTITPGSAGSAEFTVTGEPSKGFSITLPASAVMSAGGGATRKINVSSFTSSPFGTGTIGGGGSTTLYVGATRAAILANQVAGAYTVSFNVTVTYQ